MLNWGYAVTDHVAQGRTVTGGRAVIAGTEDRQHAYVALSCGTDTNMQPPKRLGSTVGSSRAGVILIS